MIKTDSCRIYLGGKQLEIAKYEADAGEIYFDPNGEWDMPNGYFYGIKELDELNIKERRQNEATHS